MGALRTIKAIIFDLDDTLVKSGIDYYGMRMAIVKKLIEMGADHSSVDLSWTITDNIYYGKKSILYNKKYKNEEEIDYEINTILTSIEIKAIDHIRPITGSKEVLYEMQRWGLPTAILTRASREYASKVLAITGMNKYISYYICRDDYRLEEAKPNPLALERAAQSINERPRNCLYVGDHVMDLECAKAAGAQFLGVLTGQITKEMWLNHGCNTILQSIAELPKYIRDRFASNLIS
ncbi:MAG: HAD family hydrolase [Methanomassiliicoccales archaeon]